jgi:hypothetical protein
MTMLSISSRCSTFFLWDIVYLIVAFALSRHHRYGTAADEGARPFTSWPLTSLMYVVFDSIFIGENTRLHVHNNVVIIPIPVHFGRQLSAGLLIRHFVDLFTKPAVGCAQQLFFSSFAQQFLI